jgi:hypothetical protein
VTREVQLKSGARVRMVATAQRQGEIDIEPMVPVGTLGTLCHDACRDTGYHRVEFDGHGRWWVALCDIEPEEKP